MSDIQAKIKHLLSLHRFFGLSDDLTSQCMAEILSGGSRKEPEEPKEAAFARPKAIKVTLDKPAKGDDRLPRRSLDEIQAELGKVVGLLKKRPNLRAEEIRGALDIDRRSLPRTIVEGLKSKALKKKGTRRATTYTAT